MAIAQGSLILASDIPDFSHSGKLLFTSSATSFSLSANNTSAEKNLNSFTVDWPYYNRYVFYITISITSLTLNGDGLSIGFKDFGNNFERTGKRNGIAFTATTCSNQSYYIASFSSTISTGNSPPPLHSYMFTYPYSTPEFNSSEIATLNPGFSYTPKIVLNAYRTSGSSSTSFTAVGIVSYKVYGIMI